MHKILRPIMVLAVLPLAGCTSLWTGGGYEARGGSASSLVDYLYPDGRKPEGQAEHLPVLALPLRVGIAFVPGRGVSPLSADERLALLDGVAARFRDRPFVSDIQVIPDTYLRTTSGVLGMQQVAALFDVDVMALVSYDQLTISGERDSALLYWTVVGALVVKGNVNEVQTMIDTAVFDVDTGKLLFRAPGMQRKSANSTYMDVNRDLRTLSEEGFQEASTQMTANLDEELETFRAAVKEGRRAEATWKPGSGGGSTDAFVLMLLAGALLTRRSRRVARHENRPRQQSRP